MPTFYVADASGTFQRARNVQVADASGTLRPPTNGQVADASGTYRKVWPLGPSISSFTALAGTPPYDKIKLSWAATGAQSYTLSRTGVSTPLLSASTATSYIFTAAPATSYSFTLQAIAADGSTSTAGPITYKTAVLPAPGGFRYDSLDHNSVRLFWTAVADATGYELVNTANNSVIWTGAHSSTGVTRALTANTNYSWALRTKLGAASSGLSSTLKFTSLPTPGPAAGSYTFDPTSSATWQAGESGGQGAAWRPQSEGLYHGNGNDFGSTRGSQTGVMFYGNRPFTKLKGGRVTAVKIYLYRTDDSGYSTAQLCRWWLHNYTGRPSGSPLSGLDYQYEAGTLARGQGEWITLPDSWGQKLVDGTAAGIAWGNVNSTSRYMRANAVSSSNSNGRIVITIG